MAASVQACVTPEGTDIPPSYHSRRRSTTSRRGERGERSRYSAAQGAARRLLASVVAFAACATLGTAGQVGDRPFSASEEHPAIRYASTPTSEAVGRLNLQLASAATRLSHDGASGYLRSVLQALSIPVDSQVMVFSKTGVQGRLTSPSSPRALFFNDRVVVGYVRGAPVLELIAHDARQGAIFYTLDQTVRDTPVFTRRDTCLSCHLSRNSLDVPGMLARSQFTSASGATLRQLGQFLIDHRSPLDQRWGGYYVTGTHGAMRHMGNAMVTSDGTPASTAPTLNVTSLEGRLDAAGYPSPFSDIVSLMVFDHQMHMINLLTRVGWEARVAIHDNQLDIARGLVSDAVADFVDYLLFVDEAPLTAEVQGVSGFATRFGAQGPHDKQGRSLYQLDLKHRLLRYPCSYMIYTDAFESLPPPVLAAVYQRMWQVLSGQDRGTRYSRLSLPDRRAIVEILRSTKAGLPPYFAAAVR
jgi:hypothetical protein